MFFTFLKEFKWYQIAQNITYKVRSHHFGCWCSNQSILCAIESTGKLIKSYYRFRKHSRCFGFFGAIGSYISGSALEEILSQLGMCQPSIMSTVFSEKHCNRRHTLHNTFGIAITRLNLHKTCTIDVPKTKIN